MSTVARTSRFERLARAVDGERLWRAHEALGTIGATGRGGVNRLAFSQEEAEARRFLAVEAAKSGWSLAVDPIGNLFIRRPGTDSTAEPVVTGSHIDTQPTGGKYDGAFGVLAGIEVLRALDAIGLRTRRPIEVAIWTNEEGCRFAPGMMGSEAFAGIRPIEQMFAVKDKDGVSVADAVGEVLAATPQAERRPVGIPVAAYVEAHIEQGPELEASACTIGVVTGIQGCCRFRVEVCGEEAHPGTTRRRQRKDALMTAVAMIRAIEARVEEIDPKDELRLTVGMLQLKPNVASVVASWAYFSVDLRHPDDAVMLGLASEIEPICRANARGCELKVTEIQRALSTRFEGKAIEAVRRATLRLGYRYLELPSGAGHDARQLARVCPTGMVFVPCALGISHNEAESAKSEDLAAGTRVLAQALLELADDY